MTWIAVSALSTGVIAHLFRAGDLSSFARTHAIPVVIALLFALTVWKLRAATLAGVFCGALVCFSLLNLPGRTGYAALSALVSLFVVTFAATRYGRLQKEHQGTAESRRGRAASQIIANLGCAALFALAGFYPGCLAAMAEAAADTTASEMGQAIAGPVRLITSWRAVPPGTDGGISLIGTLLGIVAAAIIVAIASLLHPLTTHEAVAICLSASGGLLFDSVLGATAERRGWIGNDLVNALSTLFAAVVAQITVSSLGGR